MFCPECGTDNARNQKFCTRCGTSLLAIEYARSIVNEMAAGKPSHLEAATVLRTVAWISTVGLLLITLSTIFLSVIYNDRLGPPIGLFFGVSGLVALVVIIRQLLKLIARPEKQPLHTMHLQATTNPLLTNRTLTEGNQPYYSVTEERTRQLEQQ